MTKPRFLPFVSKDTPITTVLKKLLEGTLGVNMATVLSVANMITVEGIEDVRNKLEAYTHLNSWEEKFTAMVLTYPYYAVPVNSANVLGSLKDYVKDEDFRDVALDGVTTLEAAFVVSLSIKDTAALGALGNLKLLTTLDSATEYFANIKLFSSSGKPMYFESKNSLTAYIFYQLHISKTEPILIEAIWIGINKEMEEPPF